MKLFPTWLTRMFTNVRGSYEPGGLERYLIGNTGDPSTVYMSKDAAMRVSAVFAAVRLLSTTVAYMALPFYRKMKDGSREKDEQSDLYKIFRFMSNRYQNRFVFMEGAMMSLLMRGDFFAQKIYNGKGEILELYPLSCDRMRPHFIDGEQVRYEYTKVDGSKVTFKPEDIFHVKALGSDPLKGMSVLDQAMQTTGFAAAQQEHGRRFYTGAVRPSGVLKTPTSLSEPAKKNLKESWGEYSRGALGGVAILEQGLDWVPLSFNMEQSQFVQTSEATVADIARWFGVPPHLIGDLRRATFSNIEHQSLEFMKYHLDPTWLERWQMAINTQLINRESWGEHYCEFLTDKLLRTDTLSRYQTYQIGRQNGWLNADEIRAKENMNPLPDDQGKEYVTALNLGAAQVGNQSNEGEDEETPAEEEEETERQKLIIEANGTDGGASLNLFLKKPKQRSRIVEFEPTTPDGKRRMRIVTDDE